MASKRLEHEPLHTEPRPSQGAVLEVDHLVMHYATRSGQVSAIEGVSFALHRGEALGLVGESGCGKTSIALAILRLLPDNGVISVGEVRLQGQNLLTLSEEQMRRHRWRDIAMVFQGAMNAWNPVYRIGAQIKEALDFHWPEQLGDQQARERIAELFTLVDLDPALMDRYPHELSGGMRQRALIAMALVCQPQILIADEPTTALDVIVQDRILKQLKRIQRDLQLCVIFISHDIAVTAEVSDQIGVMYAGKLVEFGPTTQVFGRPRHPYSWLLLSSTPTITGPRRKLAPLEGEPPNLLDPPTGCRFHPRCPLATAQCVESEPPLLPVIDDREQRVACWHWQHVPALGAPGLTR
jgi:peptide/nickel transport system ATP-binding protein